MGEKLKTSYGFTVVELMVIVIIFGMFSAFAVPRFRDVVERSKANEAFTYLSTVQAAQEHYHSLNGTYANDLSLLDIKMHIPRFFEIGNIYTGKTSNQKDTWKLTLTRHGNSARYDTYTVIFTQEGYDANNSTIQNIEPINPMSD